METNFLKTDGQTFSYAKRAAKIQVSFDSHFNTFGGYAHSCSDHLAGDLRTSRQGPKQKVTRTGASAGTSDSLVCLRIVNGAPDIDRAGNWNVGLAAFRSQSD
jgi:hypothetical protein